MMAIAETTRMAAELQALIDARLDTIERHLLGRVPREERLAIVREVESQIEEMLAGRDGEALDRAEVLAVLGRLDPPEAYLPEEAGDASREPVRSFRAVGGVAPRRQSRRPALAAAFGLAALVGLVFGLPLVYLIATVLESEFVLLGIGSLAILLTLAAGVAGVWLGVVERRRGAWPIVGIVSGATALGLSFLLGLFLLIILASS